MKIYRPNWHVVSVEYIPDFKNLIMKNKKYLTSNFMLISDWNNTLVKLG